MPVSFVLNPAHIVFHIQRSLPVAWRLSCVLFAFFFLFFSVGCHTYNVKVQKAREAFYCDNLDSATAMIVKQKEAPANAKSRDVLKLEEAVMRMCQGQFRESETLLREVRDSFDTLENKNIKKGVNVTASMLTDDCTLLYGGEDYEKVMIRVLLAINSLMLDGSDARAYANQINLKQSDIIEKSEVDPKTKEKIKKSYKNLAIGPYICAILDDNNMMAQQDQIREFTKVTQYNPGFYNGKKLLQRAQMGRMTQKGNGNVYVFAFVGHGPYKVETNAEVTQAALMVTDMILSATSKHTVPPTIASVPIPAVVDAPRHYRSAKIVIDDVQKPILTETVTDINQIALEQFEVNRPWIVARAIARRAVKKAGIYGMKEATGSNSWEQELLWDLAGILWEASEEADTRCWSLLPGSIQVAQMELPVGRHTLTMNGSVERFDSSAEFLGEANRYVSQRPTFFEPSPHVQRVWKNTLCVKKPALNPQTTSISVDVEDGRNTYVFVYFGDHGIVGRAHANTP